MNSRTSIISLVLAAATLGVPLSASAHTRVGNTDFNGDGRDDILWVDGNGKTDYVSFMAGLSGSSWSDVFSGTPSSAWHVVGVNDFTHDGKADILWHADNGATSIWTMNGATATSYLVLPTTGSTWQVKGTGDFDADGNIDILWQETNSRELSVWLMNGPQVRSFTVVNEAPGNAWNVAGTGDFDADGKTDILWTETAANGSIVPSIWLMNGNLVRQTASEPVPAPGWYVDGIGDFDGNGTADILWNANSEMSIWFMNGTQPSFTVVSLPVPREPSSTDYGEFIVDVGDYDGDGRDDILFDNAADYGAYGDPTQVVAYLMNGDQVSSVVRSSSPPPEAACLKVWHQTGDCR